MSANTVFDAAAGQGRDWIAARIPHQGRMCLLDRVERMSAAESVCSAISHTDADNPLREGGRLGAACAIGAEHEVGSIENGKRADFLVLGGDFSLGRVFLGGAELRRN